MKNEVVVKGVVLTRAQIEEALEELNAPECPFKPGDIVRERHGNRRVDYLVVNDTIRRRLIQSYGFEYLSDCIGLIQMDGDGSCSNARPEEYELVRKAA